MTIAYDCYPFIPQDFAASIAPYVYDLDSAPDGYARLRSAALALFDRDENVRRLASNYGGWDRASLTVETGETPAFWLILFLYAHFSQLSQSMGFSNMSYASYIADWSQEDNHVLANGKHSFEDFARQYLYQSETSRETLPEFWKSFRPQCMMGHLGWLDVPDIQNLLDKLSQLDFEVVRLQHIFQGAIQNNYCLCIIQSA
jgi:hypothetical protein